MECLENYYPTWTLYHTFMTGQLIGMDKMTVIYPVGIGENWYHCIEKYTLMLSVTEAKDEADAVAEEDPVTKDV